MMSFPCAREQPSKSLPMLRTCLIAAHDPWFIQLLKIYTEECGLQVVQAFDGQETLLKVHNEQPVVVLLQMDLPGYISGKDVLQQIRDNPATSQIPVLVFSWQGLGDEVIKGATAQLIEPITYDIFVDALCAAGVEVNRTGRAKQVAKNSTAKRIVSSEHH